MSLPDLSPHFWCPSMERKAALRDTVSLSNIFYSFTPFWLTQARKFLQGLDYGCSEHVVQLISHCPTLCNPMDYLPHARLPCSSPSPRVCSTSCPLSQWFCFNHLILCCPLLFPLIFPSIKVFSNESVLCIRWPNYWSFRLSISPSSEYCGLISFRIDWFDLFTVQGTLKNLLQHDN